MGRRSRKSPPTLSHNDQVPTEPGRYSGEEPSVQLSRKRGSYTALGFEPFSMVGYRAARVAEREGRAPSRVGAVSHERIDRLKLQYQSREFLRNNGLYKGMIFRARSYIVGPGFKLICRTKSQAWNRHVEREWAEWWKHPDVRGELSGPRMEGMACDELLTCGDTAAVPLALPQGDRVQLIEAEQIIGQDWMLQGIERDKNFVPIRYWVSPYDPKTGYPDRSRATAHSPEAFFYVSSPERPSSNRSVPPCQAAFPMLHRINDVCDSEALAWQMQARIALISNRTTGPMIAGGIGNAQSLNRQPISGDATNNYFTELDYALIFHAKPGETVSGMERTAPSGNFTETLTMFFRLLGLPLGLPLELILLDWTNSNYSQSRAVLEQAFETFKNWQDLLEDRFHRRIFEWWLKRRIALRDTAKPIEERDDQERHDWIKPTFPWIDQLQEAEAQGEKLDRAFTTHAEVCKSLNTDREDVLEDRGREVLEAIQMAQDIEAKTGVLPPWEPFCGMKPAAPATPKAENEDADDAKAEESDEKVVQGKPAKKEKVPA